MDCLALGNRRPMQSVVVAPFDVPACRKQSFFRRLTIPNFATGKRLIGPCQYRRNPRKVPLAAAEYGSSGTAVRPPEMGVPGATTPRYR